MWNVDDALNKISVTANNIESYSCTNSLIYTTWKVQIGVYLRKKVLWSDANIKICGTSIKIVNSTKYLGILTANYHGTSKLMLFVKICHQTETTVYNETSINKNVCVDLFF